MKNSNTSRTATSESTTARKSFLPYGRSNFAVAREIINDCYDLERQMGHLANYFDYDAYARDLFMYDYYYDNGYVFRHY
uniref:antirestriction protein ArdA n=1 Tax=Candidatus Limisoma sp. TaxID=3076476 RepID=UPI003FF0C08B